MTTTGECVVAGFGDRAFPEVRAAAEQIEADVFGRAFGETAEALRGYYDAYLPQTVFVLVRDGTTWAGMVRLALPGPLISLTLEDAVAPPFLADVPAATGIRDSRMLDVLTAGVLPRHRARRLVEQLAAAVAPVAREHDCSHLIGMVDRRLYGYLRLRRLRLQRHASWHPYYGSPATTVASAAVADVEGWIGRH